MGRTGAIFKKEFIGYFDSMVAYFFLFIFLAAVNMFFVWFSFLTNPLSSVSEYFNLMIPAIWLFLPALTMRAWAEEKKLGTIELLMTMPLKDSEAVAGKFLAAMGFMALILALSFISVPLMVIIMGDPDPGTIWGGYLGLLLLGGTLISLGLAISSLTENQFIAFILTSMLSLLLLGLAELIQFAPLPAYLVSFITWLDAGEHFEPFSRGIVDSRDVLYYLSMTALFLFFNYRAVSSRRWK